MILLPLIYLKGGKAVKPVGSNPVWFREEPLDLAKILAEQGAEALFIQDLNVPTAGRSENFPAIESIQKKLKLSLWIAGHFHSLSAIEDYATLGVDKIIVGASAYENPKLLQEVTGHWPKKIVVQIEVRNKRVVIPGMVSPAHKTALDYASRFEETGVAALCYTDDDGNFNGIREFCNHVKVPILCLNDIQSTNDLEKLFECEASGLAGVVLGKSIYENRIDLHGSLAFLNDLVATKSQEPTLKEE